MQVFRWLVDAMLAAFWGAVFVLVWLVVGLLVSRMLNLGPYFDFALLIVAMHLAPPVAVAGVICGPILDRFDGRGTLWQGVAALAAGVWLALYVHQLGEKMDALIVIALAPAQAVVLSSIGTRLLGLHVDRWLGRLVAASILPLAYLGFLALLVLLRPEPHGSAPLDREFTMFLMWAGSLALLGPVCFPPSVPRATAA